MKIILVCCGCDHEPAFRDETMRSLWQRILFSDKLNFAVTIPAAVGFISSYINWRYIPLIVSIPPTIVGGAQILTDLYKALSKLAKCCGKSWYHKFFGKYWIGLGKPNSIMEYERDLKYLEKLDEMDEDNPLVKAEKRITCLHLLENNDLDKLKDSKENIDLKFLFKQGIGFYELCDKVFSENPNDGDQKTTVIAELLTAEITPIDLFMNGVYASDLYAAGIRSSAISQIDTTGDEIKEKAKFELGGILQLMEQRSEYSSKTGLINENIEEMNALLNGENEL